METHQELLMVVQIIHRPHSLGILIEWKHSSIIQDIEKQFQVPTRWGY